MSWQPGDVAVSPQGQQLRVIEVDDHPLEYAQLLVEPIDSVMMIDAPPFWISERMLKKRA